MKNKVDKLKVYKYIFNPFRYLFIGALISYIALFCMFLLADMLYRGSRDEYIIYIIDIIKTINHRYLNGYFYVLIFIILTILFYAILSYKFNENLVSLIDSVEDMANGNLDKTIENSPYKDISKLSTNINNIVSQLKNITVDEKNAQQTKTDLITNVSHDLRTPLTSIIGYLGLIEEDKYKDEVHLRYYTNIAYEKSKDLNILINDLFELTKMQNNTISLNKIDINLVELLGQVLSHLNYQIQTEDMSCRIDFSDDKLIVNADPVMLVRVFENLITNAIKYAKSGKFIDITTEREEDKAIVNIINYGDPIPVLDIPHIFDRFYRVDKSRNEGGSGLGLAITKNIVEIHSGEISVTSNIKKTIFKISLPLNTDTYNEI